MRAGSHVCRVTLTCLRVGVRSLPPGAIAVPEPTYQCLWRSGALAPLAHSSGVPVMEDVRMRIRRPSWLLLGMLICLSGCASTPTSVPDSPRPSGQIPTPQDAPAEPTFKPDVPPQVPPRFMQDAPPIPHGHGSQASNTGSREGFSQRRTAIGMAAEAGGAAGHARAVGNDMTGRPLARHCQPYVGRGVRPCGGHGR
jgi:hypothetical protein